MHYPVFLEDMGLYVCLISLIKSKKKEEEQEIYRNPYTSEKELRCVALDEVMQTRVDELKSCIEAGDEEKFIEQINYLSDAATRIQAVYRGIQVRKKAQEAQPARFLKRIVDAFACCIPICRRSRYRVDAEPDQLS